MNVQRQTIRKSPGPGVDFAHKRILVIDDFGDMRSMLRSMLESYGVRQIDQAANGPDAIDLMARNAYDVILCDYNLGNGQDGQQVLEEAKFKDLLKVHTVFIMVTAENTMRMVMGAVEYQPDDYLSKPFNKFELRARLERVIARKSDLEEIERAIGKRRLLKAIELCDARIAEQPANSVEVVRIKAGLLVELGRYDEAEAIYRGVLEERAVPWASAGLGKLYLFAGRHAEARNVFQEMIDDNPNNMEAHDGLAQALIALGDLDRAEQVLLDAVEASPKAIRRQMTLGDLALKKQDYDVAARAFQKAVVLGKHSVYKSADNYVKQAKALSHGSGKDALRVLRTLRKEFQQDKRAQLHAGAAETMIFQDMGLEQDAAAAYERIVPLYNELKGRVATATVLDVARAALLRGDTERGIEIMKQVVANHHDDEGLLGEVQEVFAAAGLEAQGSSIIESMRKDVVQLNNKGVHLAEQGKLDEALKLFEQARKDMPANKTINKNTAKVMLLRMRRSGKDSHALAQVRDILEQLQRQEPANGEVQRLTALYEEVAAAG